MLPASATRPDALISGLFEATWPLLIPIVTLAPLLQAAFCEAIWTFHAPSNVAAAAGVAIEIPRRKPAIIALRRLLMTCPCWFDAGTIARRYARGCDGSHTIGRHAIWLER